MTTLATSIDARKNSFERELRIFPFRRFVARVIDKLLQRYVKKLGAQLDETYIEIDRALLIIKNHTKQDAQQDLPIIQQAIQVFARFDSRLFKADYFKSKEIEFKMGKVISRIYDAELELKLKAFAGEHVIPTSRDLADAMVEKSKSALVEALSKKKE